MVGGSEARAGPSQCLSNVRRKRTSRVSSGQIDALLSILEVRPHLFTRKFAGPQGRENFDDGWKEIAVELNQVPNGSYKTPEQWMTVWRDFKSRACTKAAKLQREKVQTGNRTFATASLSEVEKRIVNLVDIDYTFGSDCHDSMPEEDTQLQMEAGELTAEIISLPQSQYGEIEFIDADKASLQIITARDTIATAAPPPSIEPEVQQPTIQQERFRRNRNLNSRRSLCVKKKVAWQDFLSLQQSNAESMRMLAAVTQVQAEAAKMQAEAAKAQAEASHLLAQAANKIGDALLMFTNKNNNS